MLSSDQIVMADFDLCLENETWSIPKWDAIAQTAPRVQQVQYPEQQPEQNTTWQKTVVQAPICQHHNQTQYYGQPALQDHQYSQNVQFNKMTTPIQFQQTPGYQFPVVRSNQMLFNKALSHHAQITIVHAPSGTSKAIIKRKKRKRTAFTTEQILVLEQVFCKKPYVNRDDRQALAEKLQISDRAIKVWFQNRRIKSKREEMEASSSDLSPLAASDSPDSCLAYVEAQIYQNVDEFGYVTLDDRAIGELVNAIDSLVPVDVFDSLSEENVSGMEYEPISPAPASSDSSAEDAANWNPPEPEKSLRQLLDIHDKC